MCALHTHECQLRRVLRVGGQSGAGRVAACALTSARSTGLVGYGQDALAASRASPEIKEACKRTSNDGGFRVLWVDKVLNTTWQYSNLLAKNRYSCYSNLSCQSYPAVMYWTYISMYHINLWRVREETVSRPGKRCTLSQARRVQGVAPSSARSKRHSRRLQALIIRIIIIWGGSVGHGRARGPKRCVAWAVAGLIR